MVFGLESIKQKLKSLIFNGRKHAHVHFPPWISWTFWSLHLSTHFFKQGCKSVPKYYLLLHETSWWSLCCSCRSARFAIFAHSLCVVSHEWMNVWKGSNISLLVLQHWHLLLFKVCIAIHLSPKNHLNNQIFYRFYRTFSASGHPQYWCIWAESDAGKVQL